MTANHPQLNQDALEAAADAVIDASFGQELPEAPIDLATAAVSAYFAASPGLQLPKIRPAAIADNTELFMVASTHHFHDHECLCGFKSPISRERTEHIMMHTLDALLPEEQS